jgi:alkylhydroperoxidase family enzyme
MHVRDRLPELAAAIGAYRELLSTLVSPALVELCGLRIAQIVDGSPAAPSPSAATRAAGLADRQLQDLAGWRDSDQFDATQKAALELAEYLCYSAQSVTDEHVADVARHLSAEQVIGLTTALWLADGTARLANFVNSLGLAEPAT